ncbi:hypothetical protein DFJ77DRAFT_512348 [Powellomyces hirtus]|nr:hypothetical protein DFJ77DRAFT_512348 [Powellomyces hirtus]
MHADGHTVRVAVVDDNPIMQQIMVKTLHKYMRIRVHPEDVFTDGLSLLNALTLRRYDMILLDLEMPIMDGLQATLRIRNPSENPELASVRHNLQQSSNSLPSTQRPVTPSPTVRQMRYALTSTGSGASTKAIDNLALNILDANRRIPIIAVTANAFLDQQRRHCLAVGIDDVISKPIAPAEIMKIMNRYLDSDSDSHVHLSVEDLAGLVEPTVASKMTDGTNMPPPVRPKIGADHALQVEDETRSRSTRRISSGGDLAGLAAGLNPLASRSLSQRVRHHSNSPPSSPARHSSAKGSIYKSAEEEEKSRNRAPSAKVSLYSDISGEFSGDADANGGSPRPFRPSHAPGKRMTLLYADTTNDDEPNGNHDGDASDGRRSPAAEPRFDGFTKLNKPPERNGKSSLYHDTDDTNVDDDDRTGSETQQHSTLQHPASSTHIPPVTGIDQKRAACRTFPLEEELPSEFEVKSRADGRHNAHPPYQNTSEEEKAANAELIYNALNDDQGQNSQRAKGSKLLAVSARLFGKGSRSAEFSGSPGSSYDMSLPEVPDGDTTGAGAGERLGRTRSLSQQVPPSKTILTSPLVLQCDRPKPRSSSPSLAISSSSELSPVHDAQPPDAPAERPVTLIRRASRIGKRG